MALQDNTVVSYLLSSVYSPDDEFSINPLDQELKIVWPSHHLILSKKDQSAQSFQNYLLESKDLPKDNQNWVER
jgi:dTDP-4-dehydrorhamnose 3,5-epimerase